MEFAAGVLEFIGVGQVTDVTEQAVLALAAKVLFFYLIGLKPGHLYQKFWSYQHQQALITQCSAVR